jgi:DNA-binding NtrC family response regulator
VDGSEVEVTDLGSRNGSWLRLPPRAPVRVAAPADVLSVFLALPGSIGAPLDQPSDASWNEPSDFVMALVRSVEEWLERRDILARVRIEESTSSPNSDRLGRFTVAPGVELVVEPVRTIEAAWFDILATIDRYIARHLLLFVADEEMRDDGIIVTSDAMRRAVARVVQAAESGARTLLLVGPSGTGKEGLARCFHRRSRRPGGFVARNCALLDRELARSELFGAERGSFTGATQRIEGAVEAAKEGTLFLDELGELPPDVQSMLLRFLDSGEYERLGRYGKQLRADVRVVGATNKDLRTASLSGAFRQDLWFRLSVHVVDVPPLRERPDDLFAYLRNRSMQNGRSLFEAMNPDALKLLRDHHWDGNFRELINFAERLVTLGTAGVDAQLCRRALQEGSLRPVPVPSVPATLNKSPVPELSYDLAQAAETAARVYMEDHRVAPRTWDEVKQYIENYFKPVLFARLSGADHSPQLGDVDISIAAKRVSADRGTASKQVDRYFDRFGSREGAR